MNAHPLSKVYQLIEPGPVVLLATAHKGRKNVMTLSWHMMVEFEPPLVACVVSERNFSYRALIATGECVIAIPAQHLAKQVVRIGNTTGRSVDKFSALGLTPLRAKRVGAPLVAECFANLECRIYDAQMAGKYNLFLLQVMQAWIDPAQKRPRMLHHMGYGTFAVDGEIIHLKSRKR